MRLKAAGLPDYAYQEDGIYWLRRRQRAMLGDDPGLGKTRQLILAAEEPVLVVSPADLEDTWRIEIERWRPDLDWTWTSYQSLVGRLPNAKGELRLLSEKPKPQYAGPWATTVCDEAHYLKQRETRWTKALQRLDTERLYLATGTPVPNWAHEIYMPLKLLNPGQRWITNYWRWVREWFQVDTSFVGTKHLVIGDLLPGRTWSEFVRGNGLDETLLRRERDQVQLELPPLVVTQRLLSMTPTQARFYRQLKKDYLAWLPDGQQVVVWSDGERHNKLMQAASGLESIDPGASGGCKMVAWAEILKDSPPPVVAFCHYRATAEAAVAVARQIGLKAQLIHGGVPKAHRDQLVRRLQAGQLQVLVGSYATLAEGRTLTAASVCVRIERSWRPSFNEQAMRRLHRIGQLRPVHVIDLVTKDTLDAAMLPVLRDKTDSQVKLLRAVEVAQML